MSLICASGSHAPFKDDTFDLIICTEVLEHLKNPEEMISEISGVLTRRGTAIISIPSLSLPQMTILWIAYRARKISEKPYQSPNHVREYARFNVTPHLKTSTLFKLFRQKGLEIQDAVTVQQLYYTKPKTIYNLFLSKIERIFQKFFSKHLIGHNTVFRVEKR